MAFLKVPDAATQKDFVRNACEAWRAAHPKQHPRRGRPSVKAKVFKELEHIWGRSQRRPSQGRMIQDLAQKFPDLHTDTLRKYAKIWRHYQLSPQHLTAAENAFMTKHQKSEALRAIETLLKKHCAPQPPKQEVAKTSDLTDHPQGKPSRQSALKARSRYG